MNLMLSGAFFALISATTPIDVSKVNMNGSVDSLLAGDVRVEIYFDHDTVSLAPQDFYNFHDDWKQGAYAVKMDIRDVTASGLLAKAIESGQTKRRFIDDSEELAFKRRSRVVLVIAKKGDLERIYYVNRCELAQEGDRNIQTAPPSLMKWLGAVSSDFLNCKK